ncbi:hypothetical protein DOQ97_18305 [Salmonella enterica subsp. enterica]|nr:hypothetical protein [Salmonella enterica subsp. enterica]
MINDKYHIYYDFIFLSYNHINCPFPAAQIRFPAVQDLPLPPHNATSRHHNMWCRIQLLMTLYVVSSP